VTRSNQLSYEPISMGGRISLGRLKLILKC
jgi:hypothetical protein